MIRMICIARTEIGPWYGYKSLTELRGRIYKEIVLLRAPRGEEVKELHAIRVGTPQTRIRRIEDLLEVFEQARHDQALANVLRPHVLPEQMDLFENALEAQEKN